MRHRRGERWPGAGRILDGGGPASSGPATLGALAGRLTATLPGYTPKHLAEKILTSRTALEGERKQVTVLFADCARFTELSRSVDAEELHQVMDGYVQLQVRMWDKGQGKMKTFGEWDAKAGKFIFHPINVATPYHFVWTATEFEDSGLEIRFLRIRFTQPYFTSPGSGECLPRGVWLAGNISPQT